MKILFQFIIITFLANITVNAQNYFQLAQTGHSWTEVQVSSIPNNTGIFPFLNQSVNFTGFDTTIENYPCVSLHQNDYSMDSTTMFSASNRIGYLYENGHKQIYYLNVNHCSGAINTMLLYDFSKNIGDTIVFTTDTANIVYAYQNLVISFIDSVYIFNSFRKQFHFSNKNEIWIEGIGSIYGLLHTISGNLECYCYSDLVCYKMFNAIYFSNPYYNGCYPAEGSVISSDFSQVNKDKKLIVFPNPVKESSRIEINTFCNNDCIYEIYSISGKKLFFGIIENNSISLSSESLSSGMYLVKIITDNTVNTARFIIQ